MAGLFRSLRRLTTKGSDRFNGKPSVNCPCHQRNVNLLAKIVCICVHRKHHGGSKGLNKPVGLGDAPTSLCCTGSSRTSRTQNTGSRIGHRSIKVCTSAHLTPHHPLGNTSPFDCYATTHMYIYIYIYIHVLCIVLCTN